MSLNYQILLKQNLQDLNPLFAGEAECPPGLLELADARSCSVLYYLYHGSGTVRIKGITYPVRKGEFFLVPVGELAQITAAEDTGWGFRWIGFNGTLAYDFLQLPPVFSLPDDVTVQLYDLRSPMQNVGTRIASDLLLIHSTLSKPKPDRTDHVQRVVDHILSSYMFKVSVTELAQDMGIHSCHLSRQFTKKMGCSIQKYLLSVRVANAKNHLNQGYSVKETALLCGFGDSSNFSKLFKKEVGLAPSDWRKQLKLWDNDRQTPYPPKQNYPLAQQKDSV